MKIIITLLSILYASTVFAAGGVRIHGDLIMSKETTDPYRVMYLSDGSSQSLASQWSFNGSNIYFNPTIPRNVGIGNNAPTTKLDISARYCPEAFSMPSDLMSE
jgi:hypothetical protein